MIEGCSALDAGSAACDAAEEIKQLVGEVVNIL